MKPQSVITLREICDSFNIDFAIIHEFAEFGLYPVVSVEGETGIETRYLDRVKRVISLYKALGVNKEGIDIILDLREEIFDLQAQVDELRNEVERLKSHWELEDPELLSQLGLLIEISD